MDAPIWKDTYYSNYFDTLEYYIKDIDADEIILQAYTKKMPGWTGVTLNINNRVDEYLKPDFASDFRGVSDAVIANPDAYKTYQLRDLPVSGLLETYHFLYDWSYKDDWSGETAHNMSSPVKRLDPRMKAMFTLFDSAQTSFDYSISYNTFTSFFPRQVYFGVSGGSRVVRITSNDSWEITSMPGWLSADITAGTGSYSAESVTAITFTASANTAAEDRTGIVEFTQSDGVLQFGFSQAGVLSFDVTPDSVSLEASGGTIVITINTNSNWEVISYPSWVSLSQTTGGTGVSVVTATASTNDSFYTLRQDNIVIVSGGKRQGVCVSQNHMVPEVSVSPLSYEFEYTGGTMQLTIDSNIDWYITSYPKWATFSALSGDAGSTVVTVTVGVNGVSQRTGTIVVQEGKYCTEKARVELTQKEPPAYINTVPSSLLFESGGEEKTLLIISNVNWEII